MDESPTIAFTAGAVAAQAGIPRTENPFNPLDEADNFIFWFHGWSSYGKGNKSCVKPK